MGNRVSISAPQDREASKRSANIDRIIEEDSKRFRRQCKVLLLGSSGSGKSTAVKQMKIAHQGGFPVEERVAYRAAIYQNLLESAQAIVFTMRGLSIEPATAEQIASYELNLSIGSNFRFPEQLTLSIGQLWCDPTIRQIVDRHGSEFDLMDNASYFLNMAERIGSPNYIPNETDILMCRQTTARIVETEFDMPPLLIHTLEVGGRSDRRKWVHYFEGVTNILFCAPLSEYDQVLPEERNRNRMVESLELFESILNSRWFMRTSIILFLNKVDVFRRKLPKVRLEQYFPDYTGGPDINKAAKYILLRFMQSNRAKSSFYPHLTNLTQATGSSDLHFLFLAVQQSIVNNALNASGILGQEGDTASPQGHVL